MAIKHFGFFFGGVAPAEQTFSEYMISKVMKAWLRLGESSGTAALDSSANSNDATYSGTFTLSQTGLVSSDSNTAVLLGSDGVITMDSIVPFANAGSLGYDFRIAEKYS